jgi:hypothetical protein
MFQFQDLVVSKFNYSSSSSKLWTCDMNTLQPKVQLWFELAKYPKPDYIGKNLLKKHYEYTILNLDAKCKGEDINVNINLSYPLNYKKVEYKRKWV